MKKEELLSYKTIKKELVQIKEKLDEVEQTYREVKAVNISGMPKSGRVVDTVGENVARIGELREIYLFKTSKLLEIQINIEKAIEILDPEERFLIRKRYLDGMKWEDICDNLNYSWKTAHRIHKKAVDKLKVDIE